MNCWEALYMNMLYKQGILISEQQVTDTNPLFDLAIVPRDLQATSPNSSSQLVAPSTHTTGPKNHAAKHGLRTKNITSNFSQAR